MFQAGFPVKQNQETEREAREEEEENDQAEKVSSGAAWMKPSSDYSGTGVVLQSHSKSGQEGLAFILWSVLDVGRP